MASTDKPVSPPKTESSLESGGKSAGSPVKSPRGEGNYFAVDVTLRILLFVTTLVSIVVMATSDQTVYFSIFPMRPQIKVPVKGKFTNSPALIYFIVASSVACLYSIITTLTLASFSVILKPIYQNKLLLHVALLDVLVLGLVASATGTAGGVAYIGLKGNSHSDWKKVCDIYDIFCLHLGSSIVISLLSSFLLVFLVSLSLYSLHSKIGR